MDINKIDQQAFRLKWAREQRGFETARAFAERHGFKYSTYSQHERGLVGITRAARNYAKALRISEAWLLTGEGTPAPDLSTDAEDQRLWNVFRRIQSAPPKVQANILSYAEYVLSDLTEE